jgi:O-antigen/teichoic acid export membrane protein
LIRIPQRLRRTFLDNIKSSVSKNIFSLLFGQTANLLLSFAGIIIAARYLGVNQFGEFSYLIAIVAILSKIIDAGIAPIIFRETSKDINNHELIDLGITFRGGIFVSVYLAYNIIAFILKMNSSEIVFINILMLGIFFSSKYMNIRDVFEIPFKISLKMHYPMIFNVVDNMFFLLLVLFMAFRSFGLSYFVIIYVISNLPGFFLLLYFLSKKFNYRFHININKLKWLFWESLPIFGFVVLSTIFIQSDVIMLKYMSNAYSTGIYAGASRLSLPFSIIPAAVVSTVFPLLVRNANLNNQVNNKINSISFKLLFLISFSLALIFSFKKLALTVLILGPKYIESAYPSELLLWGNVFLFLNFYALDLFTAYNKQIWNFYYSVIIVLINLAVNLVLIPILSYNGPAFSKIIAGFFATGFIVYYLKKLEFKFEIKVIKFLLMIIMIAVLLFAVSYLPLILYLSLTVVIIIIAVLLTKFFTLEELDLILSQLGMQNLSLKFRKFYY